jgi:polysaccharide export outer membrane protein
MRSPATGSPNPDSQPYSNLSFEPVDIGDLLFIYVANALDSTRSVRVSAEGTIAIPSLKDPLKVTGLIATEIEKVVAAALSTNKILVEPVVSVSVLEYRSKPVSIVGAVHQPLTLQAIGNLHLLDAIAKAGGLTPEAGFHIMVTRPVKGAVDQIQDIPVQPLMSGSDPSLNVLLVGGEEILVPPAGRFYVVGNVKNPGAYQITESEGTTVLKALALCQGMLPFSRQEAWVYRSNPSKPGRQEIPVAIKQIENRKAPDFQLESNDILYVPDSSGKRLTSEVLARIATFGGVTASGFLIYRK